jgi:hypothetical protein
VRSNLSPMTMILQTSVGYFRVVDYMNDVLEIAFGERYVTAAGFSISISSLVSSL